jgi:hypothetical protein
VTDNEKEKRVALKMVIDGEIREISFEELALSNNMAQEALVRLLVRKKMIEPRELMEEMNAVQKERYRSGDPSDEDQTPDARTK